MADSARARLDVPFIRMERQSKSHLIEAGIAKKMYVEENDGELFKSK